MKKKQQKTNMESLSQTGNVRISKQYGLARCKGQVNKRVRVEMRMT